MAFYYHEVAEKKRRMLSYGSNEGLNSVYKLKQYTTEKTDASEQPLNNIPTVFPTAVVGETKLG